MLQFRRLEMLFAGSVLVALLTSCAEVREQVKAPEVSVGDVRVTGMSLSDAQLAVDLMVKNPNAFGVSAEGLSYALKIQDKQLFEGNTGEKLRVEAGKTSKVTLPFQLHYEEVLGSITALRDSKEVRYKLSGKVDFGIFALPYSKEGRFSLPRLPEISVQSLQISQLNMTGVEVVAKLKVENPNAFPVRLDGLSYDLKLAGVALLHGQNTQPLSVKGRDDGVTSLKMNVGYAQVGAVLEKLRNAKSMPVEFTGQAKLPGVKEGKVPYTWSGDVPLVRK